ncbi:MAG: PKD domain-containing protein [Candidatus Cloacimonadales bacterium]|nr:PKD domain-containing protein [Candidatus Cloacimonadales bacterium]
MKNLMIFICFVLVMHLSATIINVPTDQPTIQAGINTAVEGDTVLVQPGTYFENVNYNGKNITIASLFLTTQDTTFISQTVIDGNQSGFVVTFENGENSTATLCGFTITNGGPDYGGGFYIRYSSPTLVNLIITNNSGNNGAGLHCSYSNPSLVDISLFNNTAIYAGGAISCSNSNLSITNSSISQNFANNGGGIYCNLSSMNLSNVTITNNSAIYTCGGIYITGNSNIIFDDENRCNIHSNIVTETGNAGQDIYYNDETNFFNVVVDTFSVLFPSVYYVYPSEYFSFDILHSINELINSDLYVSPTGDDSNSGLNANEPLLTVHYALSKIFVDEQNPHTIFFAPGIYSPDTTGEFYPFNISNYLSLEGAGEDVTILDANSTNSVINIYNSESTNIQNLSIINGYLPSSSSKSGGLNCFSSSPILENLIISNNSGGLGGGINCVYSNPTLENIIVINNNANFGGGIYCSYSNMTFDNIRISYNSAHYGGGFRCAVSNLNMKNVAITENQSEVIGGGLYISGDTNINFHSDEKCSIYSNSGIGSSYIGQDIYYYGSNTFNVIVDTFTVLYPNEYHVHPLENFTFEIDHSYIELINADLFVSPLGNNANSGLNENEPFLTTQYALSRMYVDEQNPHTIFFAPGTYSPETTGEMYPIGLINYITLEGSSNGETILDANSSNHVIEFSNSSSKVRNLIIKNGHSSYCGGIYCKNNSYPVLENLLITDNSSDDGAGIYCSSSYPFIKNTTIVNNSANDGGALYCKNASYPTLVNCILWNNSPQEIYFSASNDPSYIAIFNTDLQGGISGIVTNNNAYIEWFFYNIDQDPLFIGMGDHPFTLAEYSPCIDAGTPDTTGLYLPDFDLAGNPRIYNDIIDMGAYEFQEYNLIADFEANITSGLLPLEVQFTDLSVGNPTSWEWDFDNDGTIDSNEQNPIYIYNQAGVYSVSLTVSDGSYSDTELKIDYITVTGTGNEDELIPWETRLIGNHPNPFNPTTTISFSISKESNVELLVFNVKGQRVKTLANNQFERGFHSIIWNGDDESGKAVSSGIYYYKLNINGKTEAVKKCLLLK